MNYQYMVETSVENTDLIHKIRDRIFRAFPKSKCKKYEPHLTVIPPFEASKDTIHNLDSYLYTNYSDFSTDITVRGVGVYPTIHNPRVILLDIEATQYLENCRTDLYEWLQSQDCSFQYKPTPFHITLFKFETGHKMSKDHKSVIQQVIKNNRSTWKTTVREIEIQNLK